MTRTSSWRWQLAAGGPLIGRQAAQRLARREELRELSVLQRVERWITGAVNGAGGAVPSGLFGLVVLAVVAVAVVVIVIFLVRPGRARRSRADSVLTGKARSAQDYRRSASQLADAGQYGAAILDGVRAIAAEVDERGILPPRPGRTAAELADEAGHELPGLAADLTTVARLFDDVRYGEKDGTRAGYEQVGRADSDVRAARVTGTAAMAAAPGFGVPQ